MNRPRITQQGFTAVELLITLFVAAAFLIAGYQLFTVVIRDGGATRAEAKAANYAYDRLRRFEAFAENPCVAKASSYNNTPVTVDGLTDAKLTVLYSCPNPSAPSLTMVNVVLTYNNPPQTVKFTSYINGNYVPPAD